ncbi:MAG: glycoside hydrolase family 1 protein [Clostridia bacterium]|nr:glycoside hydrolase family 1 protein [Clostridia bacterium]
MKAFKLSEQLLLGCATAATQIEGGDYHSNWYEWSVKGRIQNDESTIVAADHYNRYKEDIDLMVSMHQEIYRLSIEWSRIEPKEGVWSEEGLKHYLDEIKTLNAQSIKPLLTLHHFSHPQWFEALGQWKNKKSVFYFKRFVKKVIEVLGSEVSEYCTINEPNVFANDSFIDGKYPPGDQGNTIGYFKASKHMIQAHLACYEMIHDMRKNMGFNDTKVGIALHLAYMEPFKKTPFNKMARNILDYSFHTMFLNGMIEGRFTFPLGLQGKRTKKFCDFMGINYYSRHFVHQNLNPTKLFGEVKVKDNLADEQVNDLGWEIYPKGLYHLVKENYEKYQLPIYITENGIPDAEDQKRAKFIYDHLLEVQMLIDEGIDVQRYYHWSLLDNLEWNDGYGPRFGLIEVNYDTLERHIRESGHFYAEICQSKAITEPMLQQYLKQTR